MALLTAAEAREHIPELAGTAEDTLINAIVARVGVVLAAWCGYPEASAGGSPSMESASYTEIVDGPGGRELRLPVWPVTAIASIYDDPGWTWAAADLVAAGDYGSAPQDGRQGLVVLAETASHGSWSTGRRAIKATFTAGFTTVPADVKLAAQLAVRAVFDLRRQQGKASVSGSGAMSMSLREEEVVIAAARQVIGHRRLPGAYL